MKLEILELHDNRLFVENDKTYQSIFFETTVIAFSSHFSSIPETLNMRSWSDILRIIENVAA